MATVIRKRLDPRIKTLVENGVKAGHRSLFVIVGDRSREQIPNLHLLLAKARIKSPSVLWMYKKDLGFTTDRKKRAAKIKREVARGIRKVDEQNPFELFLSTTNIRYTYYRESQRILGNTYGMCILQDFEALSPNILARTIETVEGGGIIVLLLRTMSSLKQLYTMTMDIHRRYGVPAQGKSRHVTLQRHQEESKEERVVLGENLPVSGAVQSSGREIVPRFNKRFLLSLASCRTCLVMDDELNILPLSSHAAEIEPMEVDAEQLDKRSQRILTADHKALTAIKESTAGTDVVGPLVEVATTLDQARALLSLTECVAAKDLKSTCVVTAARGRGKSASLGLAVATAIAFGYSNIFLTSPAPDNLKTLFEFIFKGFDALGYSEHLDYEVLMSTNPEFRGCITRVNVFREHRQTIQYIKPEDHHYLSQAELLVVDEAAAIPLPVVQKLLGPYLIFMSSTIHGYEGTGRSLSLKLVSTLRGSGEKRIVQVAPSVAAGIRRGETKSTSVLSRKQAQVESAGLGQGSLGERNLVEIEMQTPIRYASGDPCEAWLYALLCLDCQKYMERTVPVIPHPSRCELFEVNRDTLFSFHDVSELFLQRMMALYVSSHYKNTPDDLMLLADSPTQRLFVLLAPQKKAKRKRRKKTKKSKSKDPPPPPPSPPMSPAGEAGEAKLPDVLCVIQVALEGGLNRDLVQKGFAEGKRWSGDLIPWVISNQFQEPNFARLSGARIVRIATHPELQRMGYGTHAMKVLSDLLSGKIVDFNESYVPVKQSTTIAPLFCALEQVTDIPPLQWMGVSYGLTGSLFEFWRRNQFSTVYLRQTTNQLTGEHSCIMLRSVRPAQPWLVQFTRDFLRRFLVLCGSAFRHFHVSLALCMLQACAESEAKKDDQLSAKDVDYSLTDHDIRRLKSYGRNLVDYHLVLDLVPRLARWYFTQRFGTTIVLSPTQVAVLVGLGVQHKSIKTMASELRLQHNQVLALFNKCVRKFTTRLQEIREGGVRAQVTADLQRNVDSTITPDQAFAAVQGMDAAALESMGHVSLPVGMDAEEDDDAPVSKPGDKRGRSSSHKKKKSNSKRRKKK